MFNAVLVFHGISCLKFAGSADKWIPQIYCLKITFPDHEMPWLVSAVAF